MCTKEDTIKTGISIDTVKESKLKLQDTFKDSESIHLNKFIYTGVLLKPTSKNAIIASNVVVKTDAHVIKWDPVTPIFLPKKPEDMEDSNGKKIIVRYIG